jgi:DNA relaxase NicK
MKTQISIDWLTASNTGVIPPKSPAEARLAAREIVSNVLEVANNEIEPTAPTRFYTYSFVHSETKTRVNMSELSSQGMVMVMSGQALARVPSSMAVLGRLIEHGWKITRMDVAWDLRNDETPSSELIAEQLKATQSGTSRSIAAYTSAMSYTGFTVGSRKSDFYMRVYDKAKEQGLEGNWLRCEIEIKGDAAHPYALSHWNRGSVDAVHKMLNMLGGTATYITDVMATSLIDESPFEAVKIDRGETDTEGWLYKQVYPALVKFAKANPLSFEQYVNAIKHSSKDD